MSELSEKVSRRLTSFIKANGPERAAEALGLNVATILRVAVLGRGHTGTIRILEGYFS